MLEHLVNLEVRNWPMGIRCIAVKLVRTKNLRMFRPEVEGQSLISII